MLKIAFYDALSRKFVIIQEVSGLLRARINPKGNSGYHLEYPAKRYMSNYIAPTINLISFYCHNNPPSKLHTCNRHSIPSVTSALASHDQFESCIPIKLRHDVSWCFILTEDVVLSGNLREHVGERSPANRGIVMASECFVTPPPDSS